MGVTDYPWEIHCVDKIAFLRGNLSKWKRDKPEPGEVVWAWGKQESLYQVVCMYVYIWPWTLSLPSDEGGTQLSVNWHMVPVDQSLEINMLVFRVSLGADLTTHTASWIWTNYKQTLKMRDYVVANLQHSFLPLSLSVAGKWKRWYSQISVSLGPISALAGGWGSR